MSMHTGGMDGSMPESYSDMEVEAFNVVFQDDTDPANNTAPSSLSTANINWEPKDEKGGLDHNEVVELVAWDYSLGMTFEGSDNAGDYDLLPGSISLRGAFGANLGLDDELNAVGESFDIQRENERGSSGNLGISAQLQDDQGVFDAFLINVFQPYLDSGTGYAAGGSVQTVQRENNYHEDHGIRGPVLDENDDIGFVASMNREKVTPPTEIEAQGYVWYNVMEIEGVRNDYEIP